MLPDKVRLIIDTVLSANSLEEQAQLIDWTHLTRGGVAQNFFAIKLD